MISPPSMQFDAPLGVSRSGPVVCSREAAALVQMRRPGVQAVIVAPQPPAPWEAALAERVRCGAFVVPRCTINVPRPEALVHALEQSLSEDGLDFETRLALIDDLAALGDSLAQLAGCSALMLRLFTEAPTRHCGFHVDTVAPGVPPFGLLKVYNGAGTRYVEPGALAGTEAFQAYQERRERLAREWREALGAGFEQEAQARLAALRSIDDTLPFLRPSGAVHEIEARAVVAFRHLDVSLHGAADAVAKAWVHCSPMEGESRLVANFTPLEGQVALQG